MPPLSHPLRFLVVALAGWFNPQQREVIDYLQMENRVLWPEGGRGGGSDNAERLLFGGLAHRRRDETKWTLAAPVDKKRV